MKVNDDFKKQLLNQLIVHNFFDIILYMYSISLLDVRCDCILLFREINAFKEILSRSKDYTEKFLPFLRDYLLPDNIMCYRQVDIRERGIGMHKGMNKHITIGGSDTKLTTGTDFEPVNPFTSRVVVKYVY
jgi:hypothetical protein